jgi:hypothetical protein
MDNWQQFYLFKQDTNTEHRIIGCATCLLIPNRDNNYRNKTR